MTREAVPPLRGGTRTWFGPWAVVVAALAMVAVACLIHACGWGLGPARFLLILTATILAGKSVERMLRRLRPEEESRMEVGSLTAVASLVPLLGYLAVDSDWDSAQKVLVALIAVGVVGTGLILMPVAYRKLAVVGLILLHFGGIVTAVLIVETGGQAAPWLPSQIWVHLYRPYLQFMYLTNAYHFYSPEPGPPSLLYAYIIYKNDDEKNAWKGEWLHFPDREKSATPLDYQRHLALDMSIEQTVPSIPDPLLEMKRKRRQEAGGELIPMHTNWTVSQQYREPMLYSRMLLASYARHLARTHPRLKDDPDCKFYSVKIYRVVHFILEPAYLAVGHNPNDKTLYYPFFQGEFNENGEVVYGPQRKVIIKDMGEPILDVEHGNVLENMDPFLYWLLPIYRTNYTLDPVTNLPPLPDPNDPNKDVRDCMEIHAKAAPGWSAKP